MRKNKYTIIEIARAKQDMATSKGRRQHPLEKSIHIFNYLYGIRHGYGELCIPCTNEIQDKERIGECEYKKQFVAMPIPERSVTEIMSQPLNRYVN